MSMFRGCVFEVEVRERVRKWVHMEGVVCMLARVDGWWSPQCADADADPGVAADKTIA